MRSSPQRQTGSAAQNDVAANFDRLGWGPLPVNQHDLGTDYFLQVRDENLEDLGLVVGVQVKSGKTAFREPKREPGGEVVGWWFRDSDRRHIEWWLGHAVPHLVVLHDLATRESYWAQVTPEAVLPAGKGAKLLVPKSQVVDVANREALLRVAASRRQGFVWEGSIWADPATLSDEQRLRHALVVPRLVAPHPNAGKPEGLRPDQAIAMLVQVRLTELARWCDADPQAPELTEAYESPEWGWRFVGALVSRLVDGDHEPLLSTVNDAPDPATQAASAVAAAGSLIDRGAVEEALVLIDAAMAGGGTAAVDNAWLLVQRARLRAEVGLIDEAREDAEQAQKIRVAAPTDASAGAIAAAATILLFNTARWGERDVREVTTGADTAANWWLAQTSLQGMDAIVDRSFKSWARDTTVTFGGEDIAHAKLLASAITSSHAGDHSGWRHSMARLAINELTELDRHTDPKNAADALTRFCLAGDDKSLVLAARHLAADGPAQALSLAAAAVNLEQLTHTSALTSLRLVKIAGDLLEESVATATADWLLATLNDPARFVERTTPSYLLGTELVEALAAVVPSANAEARQQVMERVLSLEAIEDQVPATAWARVVWALRPESWSEQNARRSGEIADIHHPVLRLPLEGIAARRDPGVRARLEAGAREGSLDALGELGDAASLPHDLVRAHVERLSESAARMTAEAHEGKFGFGYDVARTLTVLNLWHPDEARWEELLDLLGDDAVSVDHKRGSLNALGQEAERIPDEVRARLGSIALRLARGEGEVEAGIWGHGRDTAAEAAVLAASLSVLEEQESAEMLIQLLAGEGAERGSVAALLGREADAVAAAALAVLAADADPRARAAAGAGLARMVAHGRGGALAATALDSCLEDPGLQVPTTVAYALEGTGTERAGKLLARLSDHPSARIRGVARSQE